MFPWLLLAVKTKLQILLFLFFTVIGYLGNCLSLSLFLFGYRFFGGFMQLSLYIFILSHVLFLMLLYIYQFEFGISMGNVHCGRNVGVTS